MNYNFISVSHFTKYVNTFKLHLVWNKSILNEIFFYLGCDVSQVIFSMKQRMPLWKLWRVDWPISTTWKRRRRGLWWRNEAADLLRWMDDTLHPARVYMIFLFTLRMLFLSRAHWLEKFSWMWQKQGFYTEVLH